ncbi:DoxX family protein [Aestuariivirga sp.]|uniref:DoxX family protein n=1 Tax=Aestuariivirga sp. TaxID=2650926 RepID=UPI0039E4BDFB
MSLIASVNSVERSVARLLPYSLVALGLRLALGIPFWFSGLTKWVGFLRLSDTPILLFQNEFKLHILGKAYDYPYPVAVAWGSSIAEIVFPILLALGLGTRLAAFGLLVMTALIQLTVPSGWPIHATWAAMAAGVILLGPGRISVDGMLDRA